MSIANFGRAMPIHMDMLSLIGWYLAMDHSEIIADEAERLRTMRQGLADLTRETGQDFGFDLAKWRDYLLKDKEQGYRHPYAFSVVDREVRSALGDPTFARLAALAAADPEAK